MRFSTLSFASLSFLTISLLGPIGCVDSPMITTSSASDGTGSTSETENTSSSSSTTQVVSSGSETGTLDTSSTGQDASTSADGSTTGEESTGSTTSPSSTTMEETTMDETGSSTGEQCVDYDPQACCDDDGKEIIKCSGNNVMEDYGAACKTNDDCAGPGFANECIQDVLETFSLPGGYCMKSCLLPNDMTKYVANDPNCGGGASCIGAKDFFEACAMPCNSNDDCWREGYQCRTLPFLGQPGDPKFCLMPDACSFNEPKPCS